MSHQESMMQRLMATVSAVESFDSSQKSDGEDGVDELVISTDSN